MNSIKGESTVQKTAAFGRRGEDTHEHFYKFTKSLVDMLGASVGLILALPILCLAAALIALEDGRPVIHRRRVLGVGGREFDAFKLRTMRADADQWLAQQPDLLAEYQRNVKLHRDPRITRVGRVLRKLSLDELPQFVNVLRGDMSLVGPRIIHPSELERYGDFGAQRLSVKPGITGLWQVRGRQQINYAERVVLDREYVRDRCLWLDLQILALTVPAVLLRRGAH